VFCPSEKARERASHRGVGPRIPGMNAGPKTACGGKRPQAGVFAQPLAGDPRAILRAAESESFSPEKAEYKSAGYHRGLRPSTGVTCPAVLLRFGTEAASNLLPPPVPRGDFLQFAKYSVPSASYDTSSR